MRILVILCLLSGCSAWPVVDWPARAGGAAPELLLIGQILGDDGTITDAQGAALAAKVGALKARVASGAQSG